MRLFLLFYTHFFSPNYNRQMAESKYKIVKGKTGKSKKVIVEGVKKILYKKTGSQKLYCMCKGRMMNLVKYKKMKANKKETPVKKKKRRGGNPMENVMNVLKSGGAKKRKVKKGKKGKK